MQLKLKQFVRINHGISAIVRQYWLDILIVTFLAVVAIFAFYWGTQLVDPVIFYLDDVWFESDIPRVFSNMLFRWGDHYRTKVHPLFSLIAYPPVYGLTILGIEPITAVNIVIAAVASLWLSLLFIVLRLIGCRRFDAALFSVLAASSAAAMFWLIVPETFSFGSVSLLLALGFIAVAQYRDLPSLWYVAVSALTLSFTVTNWMAGILTTIVNHPWKRSLQITINAFCLVVVLWAVQKRIFPTAVFFLGDREEEQYILKPEAGGFLQVAKAFVSHTIVMPAVEVIEKFDPSEKLLSIQFSVPGSGSVWGAVAVGLWTALLGLGLWGLFSARQHRPLRIVLGLMLLGQLALHTVYGDETFLYALHFAPLLIVLAAWSTLTPARPLALVLASMLVFCAGINNASQLGKAITFLSSHAPLHHLTQTQIQARPTDPWPRGTGQVVLAGADATNQALHEPGGSFSPARGSFGISFWLTDESGTIQATSDDIPLDQINQQLIQTERQDIPKILTQTNYYQSLWSVEAAGRWKLNFKTQPNQNLKPMLVIRRVGPTDGMIRSLNWNNDRLVINDRWSVKFDRAPTSIYLGKEGIKDWMIQRSEDTSYRNENGWGYARFELGNDDWNVEIQDIFSASF